MSRCDKARVCFRFWFQRREIPWEKVPFVPRPSLVPDPVTAFGRRKQERPALAGVDKIAITPLERAEIAPKVRLEPLRPYKSARDQTREKVLGALQKRTEREQSGPAALLPQKDDVDVLLAKMHKNSEMYNLPYKRKLILASYLA